MTSETGFKTAPKHYSGQDRETVDRMRDLCHARAVEIGASFGMSSRWPIALLGDAIFSAACETHSLKYADRRGLKGPAEIDVEKEGWWSDMSNHVLRHDVADPRSERDDFTPYTPKHWVGR